MALRSDTRISTFIEHPMWQELKPFFKIETYNRDGSAVRPRVRIELRPMPDELAGRADSATMLCVACAREIHPIRTRYAKAKRGNPAAHRYFAPCCPLDVSVGCSRGLAARSEYITIKNEVAN